MISLTPFLDRIRALGAGRLRRWPLPLTSLAILTLLLAPTAALLRWPRPQARGLERLLAVSALLQSFPADPGRSVPPLWQQRLGPRLAPAAWRQQRRLWWQFWGRHGDAGAFLVLPGSQLGELPATALELDDLVVVAPDPLSRQLLQEQLRLHQRPPRGVEERCLQRLQAPQGVYWSAVALGAMAGPVSPLLQRIQQGCLTLNLTPKGLAWQGEASAVPGLVVPAAVTRAALPPLLLPADGPLLDINGGSLDLVLQGLIRRSFIREALERRYGLKAGELAALGRSPFRLQLRPQDEGAYKASLELLIRVGDQRARWQRWLQSLHTALLAQGLEEAPTSEPGSAPQIPPSRVTWIRNDGTVVGGWRWIVSGRSKPEVRLLLFLGPLPPEQGFPEPLYWTPSRRDLHLTMRPAALRKRGLLPDALPEPVLRAQNLQLNLLGDQERPGSAALSWVTGDLRLAP